MTDTYDEAVELAARENYTDPRIQWDTRVEMASWHEKSRRLVEGARASARATLEAFDAAGYVLVPKVATVEMRDAAILTEGGYRAQINAAITKGAIRRDDNAD